MGLNHMKYKRLGNFRFGDYCGTWVAAAFMLSFSVISILYKQYFFSFLAAVYAMIRIVKILADGFERFSITQDNIIAYRFGKSNAIPLPEKVVLVFSDTDVCPPLAIRTFYENRTHILKDRYSVTVLKNMPIDCVIERIHRGLIKRYTTSTIQNSIEEYNYIYSFVFTPSMLENLTAGRKCTLLIPEPLYEEISSECRLDTASVCIDRNCDIC